MLSRGCKVAAWIERYCQIPFGENQGRPVKLTINERILLRKAFNFSDPSLLPKAGPLACYLTLLNLAGPNELTDENYQVELDCWSIWRAANDRLRQHLKREGETITCPRLGRRFLAA
jgi:hypothetical protein